MSIKLTWRAYHANGICPPNPCRPHKTTFLLQEAYGSWTWLAKVFFRYGQQHIITKHGMCVYKCMKEVEKCVLIMIFVEGGRGHLTSTHYHFDRPSD